MGTILDKFNKAKNSAVKVDKYANNVADKYANKEKHNHFSNKRLKDKKVGSIIGDEGFGDEGFGDEGFGDEGFGDEGFGDDIGMQPPQKPEGFHRYVLESRYQDTEKSIRGYKDVFNKEKQEMEIKRKKTHCFTDEESEEIVRMSQSLLATDIKLGHMSLEAFGINMNMLIKRIRTIFREIAEYRYGRYSHDDKGNMLPRGFAIEQEMKIQNMKIYIELIERIRANYSRSIAGKENILTHHSVSGQESLQSTETLDDKNRRYS